MHACEQIDAVHIQIQLTSFETLLKANNETNIMKALCHTLMQTNTKSVVTYGKEYFP